ncbi:uncharacterized protein A1O5_12299 [Cladophialophora psammophila CBS 110553]|uniref:Enoyl reductase (ER) domain-containing protein n=1 Tax=Cladophialophora psammophila CBS 110553 TaxID=1182543 RepID=W9VV25_9EURO|nr:uncharacterized protein A1O5_12299 [Cladophialophora psammophila CBS 110553]EXJ59418.1 hypothetical protein A1O5_12299 [Cladophialophora psammophila CBS 110553]
MPTWDNVPKGQMTAAVLTNPGYSADPSDCFTYSTDYPRPTLPSPEWVLCRVHAAGLNRAELRGRTGAAPFIGEFIIFQKEYREEPPKILGEEFVGEVVEAGSASGFTEGEKVTGFLNGGGKAYDGAYAEFSLSHRRRLYRLPATTKLPWNVLAAVPMSMYTAWGALNLAAGLGERRKKDNKPVVVLIHGATSSVGVWGLLVAKDAGATVIATTRNTEKIEKLKAAGADHVVLEDDIDTEVLKIAPDGVDIVVELVGPDHIARCANLCARRGTAVLVGPLNKNWSAGKFEPFYIPPTRNVSFFTMTNSGPGSEDADVDHPTVEALLSDVVHKIETGVYPQEVVVDKTFALRDIGKAHQYCEENRAVGKVVVTVP